MENEVSWVKGFIESIEFIESILSPFNSRNPTNPKNSINKNLHTECLKESP
jgi:hypothetical protein